jgi:hypothetical protein
MTDPRHINAEEPPDDAMMRVYAALEAVLDPVDSPRLPAARADRIGTHECLRCGYHWTPRVPSPRACPLCRSAYWDLPPVKAYARRPENTDWKKEQARIRGSYVHRRRYRRLAKVRALARELGIEITDQRMDKVMGRTQALVMELPPVAPPPVAPPSISTWSPLRRTVPPPPGLDDLEVKS